MQVPLQHWLLPVHSELFALQEDTHPPVCVSHSPLQQSPSAPHTVLTGSHARQTSSAESQMSWSPEQHDALELHDAPVDGQQLPVASQLSFFPQFPQVPPHPSSPQVLLVHWGTQVHLPVLESQEPLQHAPPEVHGVPMAEHEVQLPVLQVLPEQHWESLVQLLPGDSQHALASQPCPERQEPQVPPQPSSPQVFPLQSGVHPQSAGAYRPPVLTIVAGHSSPPQTTISDPDQAPRALPRAVGALVVDVSTQVLVVGL